MGPRGHLTQQCMLPFYPSLCFALIVDGLFRRRLNNLFQRCSNGVLTKTVFETKFFHVATRPATNISIPAGTPKASKQVICQHVRVGLVGGQTNFELFLFRPDSLEHRNNPAGTTLGFKRAPRAGAGWSMVALRQQELLHLPAVEYSLTKSRVLPELCHLLLQKSGTLAVQGRRDPSPQQATPNLGLYADGYQPRGRPNVNTKI